MTQVDLYLLGHALFFCTISYYHVHCSPTESLGDALKTALFAFEKRENIKETFIL